MARPGTGNRGSSGGFSKNRTTSSPSSSGRSSGGSRASGRPPTPPPPPPKEAERKSGGSRLGSEQNKEHQERERRTGNSSFSGYRRHHYRPRRNYHTHHYGWGGGSFFNSGYSNSGDYDRDYERIRRNRGCNGCIFTVFGIIVALLIGSAYGAIHSHKNTSASPEINGTESVIISQGEYFQDRLGWIEDQETVHNGLHFFYEETGVSPYLALVEPVSDTNTDEECDQFANQLYDQLFQDENHFLLVYIADHDENELGYLAYVCGVDAANVMDDQMVDRLYEYMDYYWFDESYTTEEVFGNVFYDTAEGLEK